MVPNDGPVTTIIWFAFHPGLNILDNKTDEGIAWNSALSHISKESSWRQTIIATPCPTSDQYIIFIGK